MKTKIIGLYQVIMHYRVPFYEKIGNDPDYDFELIYGLGNEKNKNKNCDTRNLHFKHTKLKDYRLILPFSPTLFYILVKRNPDIVFTEGSSSLINSSFAFIYAKLFGKKIIWWSLGRLRDKKISGLRKVISYWEHFIEKNVDAIFTYSTQGEEYFVSCGIDQEKIFKAINVFDTDKKLQEINKTYLPNYLDSTKFNICFIGSIQKNKNLEMLIDVVRKMNDKLGGDKVKLHVIGDGNYLEIIKKYSHNNPNIIFYGRINYGASKILKNCDIMVLPGLGGLAIVEGMLNSLPVISGYADGTELDLIDKDNGEIIPYMTDDKLYERLMYYYENSDILKQMGENSFKKITEKYSFDNYYNVFKNLINYLEKDNKCHQ